MPRTCYVPKKFNTEHQGIIAQANTIIAEYAGQGFDLTLRQLYYQFVARDLMANNQRNYKRLGSILSDARRAGLVDWDSMVDRTRHVRTPPSWSDPAAIVEICARTFAIDLWKDQPYRPEVWVEKDALVGVLETACEPWRCPYFSCRGYTSDSDIWRAAQRLARHGRGGQTPIVFHLGDHDPSGIDMSRDIADRLRLFGRGKVEVKRIALNMDQVEEHEPPPNPAKETDARFAGYSDLYGDESWELDALSPTTISELIAAEMQEIIEQEQWDAALAEQAEARRLLQAVSDDWDGLTEGL